MKLENVTKKEKNIVELEISINAEEFEKAVKVAYEKNKGKVTVPGFRKGKAPRSIIEKMYGAGFFYEDAINASYPDAYEAAVKEAGIEPVDRADIEVLDVNAEGFKFKATVTVKPEVSIKDYKGLKVEKLSAEVTDKDVEAELEKYQHRQSRLIAVTDRPSAIGDTVIFDFEGFVDGVAFDGGKADGYGLKLGSGQFIPGFEDQMVGKNCEDEFSVNVTFPEDYQEESLKGKPAEFKIKLHEIKAEELPAIDDELAKDVSDFDTLDEFKKDILAKLTEQKKDSVEDDLSDKLSHQIADLVEADIPECMIEAEVDENLSNFDRRLRQQGVNLEKYCAITGQDINSLRAMFKVNAEYNVKLRLGLDKIAEIEQIVVGDEDIDKEYADFAEQMKTEVDKIKNDYVTSQIVKEITTRKAFELVKVNADITEPKKKAAPRKKKTDDAAAADAPAEEKKPAKKPAAKKTAKKADDKAE